MDEEYRLAHSGYGLLASREVPDLVQKSFDSILDKTLRINVVTNGRWPGPYALTARG
jgi:hypothetical protein